MALKTYRYTDDTGGTWSVSGDASTYDQAVLGMATANATDPPLPIGPGFKPRVALVINESGNKRRLMCGTKTATAYVTAETAVNSYDFRDSVAKAGVTYGYEGERRRFKVPPAPEGT